MLTLCFFRWSWLYQHTDLAIHIFPPPTYAFPLQPQIYRAIIDDVIANIAPDFEEYGMDDDLLGMLQAVSRLG